MRVSKLYQLFAFELIDVEDGIRVAEDDTLFTGGTISLGMFRTACTLEGANLVELEELALEQLQVLFVIC